MRIGAKHIIISLTQRRLSAALVRGRSTIRVEAIDLDPAVWSGAWSQGLMPFDSEIRRVLARLRAGRSVPVTVLYNSPSAVLGSFNLPGSRTDACLAAKIRARESASNHTLSAAIPIAPSASSEGTWSVLAITERDETANALFGWVTRAGARLGSLLPMQAAVAVTAARRVTSTEEVRAGCLIGRDWTAVACGSSKAFHLIRVFELGYGAMADVHAEAAGVSDGAGAADEQLFTIGVPFKNRQIGPQQRSALLPLLSPIIQRLCIEIKQTLRFGVAQDHMPGTLHLFGLAGKIPELVPALVEGIDMHIEPTALDLDPAEATAPFAPGSVEHAFLGMLGCGFGIRPAPQVAQEASDALRRATLIGAVIAAAAIGIEFGWLSYQRNGLSAQFEAMSQATARTASHRENQESTRQIALRSGRVASLLMENTSQAPDAGRVLKLIAEAIPDPVRLETIEARQAAGRRTITLHGSATGATDDLAGRSLHDFISTLTGAPEIEAVEIGATQRDMQATADATRVFTLTITLTEIPPDFAVLARFADAEDAL